MIQAARNSDSQSFLREAQEALLLFNNLSAQQLFEEKIANMIEKRANPEITYTGAKELRENILAYLEQNGEPKTANIWARKLKINREAINSLKDEIFRRLKEHKIEGVVEIHLQDREVNSSHIQFVGNNVELAQAIIANAIVKSGYEDNIDSAINKNAIPAYSTLETKYLPRKQSIVEEIKAIENYENKRKEILKAKEQQKERIKDLFKSIELRANAFRNMLKSFEPISAHKQKESRLEKIRNIKSQSTKELEKSYQKRKQR
ncbi:hypothetical protein [Helicobacter sp. MIT 14-3879]|uniref:hypothetical protein n=1 Tax=Helicobacter sp. MIT 14-3879 TaxID=2040649 RepID=UPI000E1EA9A6|nr:hypothetical protein [Helicobacter sp. MIT 14-3879]RDU61864.1 hypothetical protein CQA44_08015 [Helicobacter sp. MIT 14-3879]